MPRPRTHQQAARTHTVTVRVTAADHARLSAEAAQSGTSLAGLAERLITNKPALASAPSGIHPAALAELKRLNVTLHALARAPGGEDRNARIAAELQGAIELLIRDEILSSRINDLKSRDTANDSAPPSPRVQFQRVVHVHPARSGEAENP